jgi:hypothetical protein
MWMGLELKIKKKITIPIRFNLRDFQSEFFILTKIYLIDFYIFT